MTDIPDIAIWTHRWTPLLPRCAESVVAHARGNYNLVIVCEPGTCHQNMNRVLLRSRSRYTVFLDEDVEILDNGWLDVLLSDLHDAPDLGVVGCREIKDEFERALYGHTRNVFLATLKEPVAFVTWVPAYVMVFDRSRCASLSFDEAIPGAKGMTDVDACLQIRKHGLRVGIDNRVCVYHPHKRPQDRGVNGVPTKAEELAWFEKQRAYMTEKWGAMYTGDETLCLKT